MAGAAGADADGPEPLTAEQTALHGHIDKAIETCNGFGGAIRLNRRYGTTTAVIRYLEDHPHVGMEIGNEYGCASLVLKYPFLKGRVYGLWKTPPNESLSTILVEALPYAPEDDLPSPQVPRFVVCDVSRFEHTEPGTAIDFEDVLSYYAQACHEEESIVQGWFGYKLGRTVKGVTRTTETPKSS